ncbi:MAG: serine/threonine protein kinase, partial [Planctomycetota bacterium]
GIVHCHSIATGEPLFVDRLPSGSIWATPLVSKNGIYFFGKDGVTTILKPSDKLEIASDNSILEEDSQKPAAASGPGASFSGTVLYAAAVAKDKLLIRFGEKLFAVTKE